MFTRVAQPLIYAEALLAQFASLSRTTNVSTLLREFVHGAAGLSGCELIQLYVLDATHTRLHLSAEYLDAIPSPPDTASLPVDYNGEQLLQFALCQNRVVSIVGLSDSVHETSFLPAKGKPWQSFLCVPLLNRQKTVGGLLLCASRHPVDLKGFADSLGQLGSFVLTQLALLQSLRQPVGHPLPACLYHHGADAWPDPGQTAL